MKYPGQVVADSDPAFHLGEENAAQSQRARYGEQAAMTSRRAQIG
jgi:hypothetical protein